MFLKISDLGQVIATRTLSFAGHGEIAIRIGQPFMPPDYGGNFCCPYQIDGIGDGKIRYGSGVDSLQALYIALMNISTDLYPTEEVKAGKITWQGDRDLGLPMAEAIKEVLREQKS